MRWSQVKKQLGERLAPAVRKRVGFYNARYRHNHDSEGRGWITFDGVQVFDAATRTAWWDEWRRAGSQTPLGAGTVAAGHERRTDGVLTLPEFNDTLWNFLQMPIDAALASEDILLKGVALLDRRVGRERFARMASGVRVHPFLDACITLRAEAEAWALPTTVS